MEMIGHEAIDYAVAKRMNQCLPFLKEEFKIFIFSEDRYAVYSSIIYMIIGVFFKFLPVIDFAHILYDISLRFRFIGLLNYKFSKPEFNL